MSDEKKPCISCGGQIPVDAKTCPICGAAPGQACSNCGKLIPTGAKTCTICHAVQGRETCVNCKEPISEKAKYCNRCETYQGVLKYVPSSAKAISLVLAAIALFQGLIPAVNYLLDRDSHTKFKVTSSDSNQIILRAWNTGLKPSTLIGYRLICDKLPNKEAMLDLRGDDKNEAKNVIAPGGNSALILKLTNPLPYMIPSSRKPKQYGSAEYKTLREKLDMPVMLEIDVEESNDPGGYPWNMAGALFRVRGYRWSLFAPRQFHVRTDSFQADRIKEFLDNRI